MMEDKIIYHPFLYLGDDISEAKLDKIKKRLKDKPLLCNAYLITVSRNPVDQLEILSAKQLVQSYYSSYPVYVVGIACDYDTAVGLVERMVQECLKARGDCALKEFLLC